MNPRSASKNLSAPTIESLSRAFSKPARWQILLELAKGEALPVIELARRTKCTAQVTSKHMAVLRKAGLVQTGYGRLYQLVPALRPAPGSPTLDLGPCVLKLEVPG